MFKKLANKLNIFNKDSIMLPAMNKPNVKKEATVGIFHVKKPEDISKLKKKIENSSASFINVSALLMGTERKSFINRLQALCKSAGLKIYGIDRTWVVLTRAKLET